MKLEVDFRQNQGSSPYGNDLVWLLAEYLNWNKSRRGVEFEMVLAVQQVVVTQSVLNY